MDVISNLSRLLTGGMCLTHFSLVDRERDPRTTHTSEGEIKIRAEHGEESAQAQAGATAEAAILPAAPFPQNFRRISVMSFCTRVSARMKRVQGHVSPVNKLGQREWSGETEISMAQDAT